MICIVVGNLADGFTIFGPFKDVGEAKTWAKKELDGDWHMMTLVEPKWHIQKKVL